MENAAQLELLELITRLDEFRLKYLKEGMHIGFDAAPYGSTVNVWTYSDHAAGLEIKRLLGIRDADKAVFDSDKPWHTLRGDISQKVNVQIFCQGLPPMCRIETYEEEIPKTDVITLAETVKVKRTRICCNPK